MRISGQGYLSLFSCRSGSKNFAATLAWESRTPGWKPLAGTQATDIMGMYTPALLPVLSGLARGFAVCDQWYASAPNETLPNRAFVAAATSQGHMDDKTTSFTAPTIFGLLTQHSLTWRIHGYDSTPLTRLTFSDTASGRSAGQPGNGGVIPAAPSRATRTRRAPLRPPDRSRSARAVLR